VRAANSSSPRLLGALGTLECHPAGIGDVDDVPPPIAGVAPPFDVAQLLELVEQQDAVVGVEPKGLAQLLLLQGPRGGAQVAEKHRLTHRDAEKLLRAALVDDLGQPQKHQDCPRRAVAARRGAGAGRGFYGHCGLEGITMNILHAMIVHGRMIING
jgi:hypothetical protein